MAKPNYIREIKKVNKEKIPATGDMVIPGNISPGCTDCIYKGHVVRCSKLIRSTKHFFYILTIFRNMCPVMNRSCEIITRV